MNSEKTKNSQISTFELGDIVTMKYHPFFMDDIINIEDMSLVSVLLQSDADYVTPAMVIVEIAKIPDKQSEKFDQTSGFPKVIGYNYKCLYFNSTGKKFEEKWLMGTTLKIISKFDISKLNIDIYPKLELLGKTVILNTWELESIKRKSFLKQTTKDNAINNSIIMAHLSYLPPLMTIVGFHKVNQNLENTYDKKTGEKLKICSNKLLKCQWFNYKNGTFSEDILPFESLLIIDNINDNVLTNIKEKIINENIYLHLDRGTKILARPIRLVFNHCEYHLVYEDMITGLENSIKISNDFNFSVTTKDLSFAPKITIVENDNNDNLKARIIEDIIKFIGKGDSKYRMQYIDSFGKVTNRTIGDIEFNGSVGFKAFCYLRNQERYFNLDRVKIINRLPKL